jgi:flagellar hook-length control protein FliK
LRRIGLSREVSVPQVPQVSSPVSVDLRPPVSNAPRSNSDDAFSQLLRTGDDEPKPESRSRETASTEARPAKDRDDADPARGDDQAKSKDNSDAAGTDNSDADAANDKPKEASDSADPKGSDSQKDKDKKTDQPANNADAAAASAPVAPDASGAANANMTVVAGVAAVPVTPENTETPNASLDGAQAVGAAPAKAPQAPATPQPQLPQQAQTPAPDVPQQQAQAAAQRAASAGKPAVETKADSTPQLPQPASGKPQQASLEKPVVAQQAALNIPAPPAPKSTDSVQPQSDKPAQPNPNAVAANVAANVAVKPDAKQSADGADGNKETLEDVLSKHFSGDIQLTPNGQIAPSDTTRTLLNNPAPMSVSLQTAPAAANNQPIPLQAAALAIEIASRAKDGSRQFDIRLDPPELGRIDVKLDVDKSGQVNTHLTVDRPETLDLLRRDSQGLERALQQAGLKTSDGGLEFSLRQQTPDGQFSNRNQPQANPQANTPAVEIEQTATIHAEQYQWAARLRGGVDIRI